MDAPALKKEGAGGAGDSGQDLIRLVALTIGQETYGVEIGAVREIRAWNGATPLPDARDQVRGVINLRGTIVPIFDISARVREHRAAPGRGGIVVVMSAGEKWIGLLVDGVGDVLSVNGEDILPVAEAGAADGRLLKGVVIGDSRTVGLIDLDAMVLGPV